MGRKFITMDKTICVVISGIDGSGKTTVINALKSVMEGNGEDVGYIWLRFNHYTTKIMHALARLLGLSIRVRNEMGEVWQHRFYKSQVFCTLYVLCTYLDTLISRVKYEIMACRHDVVICDRWIIDILVDLATKIHSRDFLDGPWMRRFFRILPQGARLFVVVRNSTDIVSCRLENRTDPDFELRYSIYEKISKMPEVSVIDNTGTVAESVSQVLYQLNND